MWPDWLTFRPIEHWPGPLTAHYARKRSPFSASLSATVGLLRKELTALGTIDGTDVLQVALEERDIRLDGKPRANAMPRHPGVILSFSMPQKSYVFSSKAIARKFLFEVGDPAAQIHEQPDDDDELYRLAVKQAHPDHGGARETWDKVQEAWRLLSQESAYQFAVDTYTTWQDNLRAIALGLEALRKVERYGITRGTEQYTGWKMLTARASA